MKYCSLLLTLLLSSPLLASDGSAGSSQDEEWLMPCRHVCLTVWERWSAEDYTRMLYLAKDYIKDLEVLQVGSMRDLAFGAKGSDHIASTIVTLFSDMSRLKRLSVMFPMSSAGLESLAGALHSWPLLESIDVRASYISLAPRTDSTEGVRRILQEAARMQKLGQLLLPAAENSEALVRELDAQRRESGVTTELTVGFQLQGGVLPAEWYELPLADEAAASGGGSGGGSSTGSCEDPDGAASGMGGGDSGGGSSTGSCEDPDGAASGMGGGGSAGGSSTGSCEDPDGAASGMGGGDSGGGSSTGSCEDPEEV